MTTAATLASAGTSTGVGTTRLLDRDLSKFRSIKQVIVIGRHCASTDAIAKALKILNFKVYDFKAASDRHERDFPLWAEAARLRMEGKPYTQSDYDKVIGDHNALVGAPTAFFDEDFVTLYPNVKIIMIMSQPDVGTIETIFRTLNRFAINQVLARIDAEFFGPVSAFLELECKAKLDCQAVRQIVRANNLLEIETLDDWKPLCDFLKVREPKEKIPSMYNNTSAVKLTLRPLQMLHKWANAHSERTIRGLSGLCTVAGVSFTANLIVQDARYASIFGFGLCILIAVWYFMTRKDPKVLELQSSNDNIPTQKPMSPLAQKPQPHRNNRHNNRKHFRDLQRNYNQVQARQDKRPHPPTLPGWGNVQADIHKDDIAKYQESVAIAKESEGQPLVFNHIHKETVRNCHGSC
ncbi:hypothetical protein BKA66DRAFT_567684 [Pyrenochaeta sp. MPI-SDFR-AT-0127]|nr:hypothetical protein BKA66DRAFT_567684 [Pyrenochaeta sp. MPI-SDFR-AT-0127]